MSFKNGIHLVFQYRILRGPRFANHRRSQFGFLVHLGFVRGNFKAKVGLEVFEPFFKAVEVNVHVEGPLGHKVIHQLGTQTPLAILGQNRKLVNLQRLSGKVSERTLLGWTRQKQCDRFFFDKGHLGLFFENFSWFVKSAFFQNGCNHCIVLCKT